MSMHHLPGDPSVPVKLRRSSRARRLSLRVSQLDGRVTLTMPLRCAEREALDFLQSRAQWVRGHLSRMPQETEVRPGATLPVEGVPRTVVECPGRRVKLEREMLGVPVAAPGARVAAFLKTLARERLTAASDQYAAALGRSFDRITLRDTRSRWGSCSSRGSLMFSWRLVMAPPEVLRYVAAHEVAHLAEMNHSPAFWDTLERIHGPCQAPRAWLKDQGNALHRYRF